jgi:hypothetical protein
MPTYNGWTIVTMPSTPSAKNVEFSDQSVVTASQSPFTGQQQIYDWQASMAGSVDHDADDALWPLRSPGSTSCARVRVKRASSSCRPSSLPYVPTGAVPALYWRLKNNTAKWSVSPGNIVGMQFEIREAI